MISFNFISKCYVDNDKEYEFILSLTCLKIIFLFNISIDTRRIKRNRHDLFIHHTTNIIRTVDKQGNVFILDKTIVCCFKRYFWCSIDFYHPYSLSIFCDKAHALAMRKKIDKLELDEKMLFLQFDKNSSSWTILDIQGFIW